MEAREPRRFVHDHPQKVRAAAVPADETLTAEDGWKDMGVQWIITSDVVQAARHTVFGITTFPPGARHDIHRHPHAEEVEYLIEGSGVARIGDADVSMQAGDVIFVAEDEAHGFWNTSATQRAVMIWCYGGAASLADAGYVSEVQRAGE
ncbi:MAG: cupin domain-containing protein [Streptosporangiaceae bacterium]